MKKLALLFILCYVFFALTPSVGEAQEPFAGFLVFEEHVAPADLTQFNKVQQEAVDLWKKNKFDTPVLAYRTDESSIYWVVPISSFAAIDTMFGKMGTLSKKMKEQGYDGDKKFRDLSTISSSVMIWDPELSYHQDGQSINSQEYPYTEWMFMHLLSGHEKEASDALKTFRQYYVDNNLDSNWEVFRVALGEDTPLIIGMFRDKNGVVMQEKNQQIWQEHGEKLDELWQDVAQHARRVETKTGWYQEKFSNRPNDEKY